MNIKKLFHGGLFAVMLYGVGNAIAPKLVSIMLTVGVIGGAAYVIYSQKIWEKIESTEEYEDARR